MKKLLAIAFLLCVGKVWTQTAPETYYILFSDKINTPYSLDNPHAFLSQKSIDRRIKWKIPLEWKDLPVDPAYINQVLEIGDCHLHHTSKWFNSATIIVDDTLRRQEILDYINGLDFVSEIKKMNQTTSLLRQNKWRVEEEKKYEELPKVDLLQEYEKLYGPSFVQVSMLNLHPLHQLNYTGEGIDIAVFDAGWDKANILPVFDRLREREAIVETRDFVFPGNTDVYNISNHGTFVLSTMAGWMPDSLIGTAPDARYHLFRTEYSPTEFLVEEDNWVAAAEYADSIGIDIINSSLGYSTFDDPAMNHTYADMDGNTTRASIAADIAASKGILVVNSAGNSGASSWRYITAPSDGDSVLCVGAVNAQRIKAPFSGFGPASDGDVKPNVMAMGQATVFAALDSTIQTGNGTSFSSPIMAGAAACLMQAAGGKKSNMEIFRAIEKSSNFYNSPSDSLGYGIPDFWKALQILNFEWDNAFDRKLISVYPNPTTNELKFTTEWLLGFDRIDYAIYNSQGKLIFQGNGMLSASGMDTVHTIHWPEGLLARDVYTIYISTPKETRSAKFVVE